MPVSGITNLIGMLAHQASAEAASFSGDAEGELRYMMDEAGELVGDPALDRDRAASAWNLLNNAQAERVINAVTREQGASRAIRRPEPEFPRETAGSGVASSAGAAL